MEFIEALLKEDEGIELDFKRDQYPFSQASDEQKSELLKDLLAFANTTRTRNACIVIGADETNRNARGSVEVCGISNHLNEAHLQQFVYSKINRSLRFTYRQMSLEDKQIGLLQIPIQKRPFFAVRDYGDVKKNAVYVRRGSSTSIAGPDEIHQMGQEDSMPQQDEPALFLGFFNRQTGEQYGPQVSVLCTWIDMPSADEIPDYPVRNRNNMLGDLGNLGIHGWNQNYLRELANFRLAKAYLQPVSMSVRNSSSVTANDVRLIMEVEDEMSNFHFSSQEDMPKKPESTFTLGQFAQHPSFLDVSHIDVRRTGKNWRIEIRFMKIQAGDTVRLEEDLFVGSRRDGIVPLKAKFFADNLGRPRKIEVGIHIKSRSKTYSLADLA